MAQPRTSQANKRPEDTLALTSLHQQLATLHEERQWLLRQIRRKRTELDNFIGQMHSLVRELYQQNSGIMAEIQATDDEIHDLFDQILSGRKLKKRARRQVENIYHSLQFQGIISFRTFGGSDAAEPFSTGFAGGSPGEPDGEPNRKSDADEPQQDSPASSQRDSPSQERAFRQTFLRLASIYHPDRADNEDAQRQNTEIMKAINAAYKSGDFARLLELEQQQLQGELKPEAVPGDDLERQCQRLERENEKLREQYEGIKFELRELRNRTQEGMMVKAYRKAVKEGIDFIDELVQESEMELASLQQVRDFVRDFRDRKISLQQFIAGPRPTSQADLEELLFALEEMFDISTSGRPGFF